MSATCGGVWGSGRDDLIVLELDLSHGHLQRAAKCAPGGWRASEHYAPEVENPKTHFWLACALIIERCVMPRLRGTCSTATGCAFTFSSGNGTPHVKCGPVFYLFIYLRCIIVWIIKWAALRCAKRDTVPKWCVCVHLCMWVCARPIIVASLTVYLHDLFMPILSKMHVLKLLNGTNAAPGLLHWPLWIIINDSATSIDVFSAHFQQ